MAYETLADYNASGIVEIFQYASKTVPILFPLILFGLFVIAMLGIYFSQVRLRGRGYFTISFAVAGYLTFLVALIMTSIEIIDTFTLVICLTVAVLGSLLLFFPKKD